MSPVLVATLLVVSQQIEAPPVAPQGAHEAALLYAPPGCLDRSTSRFDLKHKLATSGAKGFRFVDVSLGAFSRGGRVLMPMTNDGDPSEVRAFLAAHATAPTRTDATRVAVAITPWELAFSVDAPDELRALVDKMPKGTVEWKDATLTTLRAGERSVRAIEIDADEAWDTNIDAWVRMPLASEAVSRTSDGKEGVMFFAGRRAGTAASIASTLASLGGDKHPLVLAGGIDALAYKGEQRDDCIARIRAAHVKAIGVRAEDLALGVDDVRALSSTLPYVAANVRDTAGKRVVPSHVVVNSGSSKFAVIGLADPHALRAVPANIAQQWSIAPAAAALEEAVDAVRTHESVDAIVVLAPSDALAAELTSARGVDVVIGDFGSIEQRAVQDVAMRQQVTGDDRPGAPLLTVRGSSVSVGRVSLLTAQGRAVAVTHDVVPAAPHAFAPIASDATSAATSSMSKLGVDPYFARAAPNAGTAFPDLTLVVARAPDELRPMIYGDVIVRGRARHIADTEPARFSDPLWGRFVARIARDELAADVALLRNLQRRDDIAGPLTRPVVEGWIPAAENVRVVDVKGDKLAKIVDVLRLQHNDRGVPTSDLLFTSGLAIDAKNARSPAIVRGRAVENVRMYRVVVSESALALPAVSAALADASATLAVAQAKPLRDVVMPRVLALADARARASEGSDGSEQSANSAPGGAGVSARDANSAPGGAGVSARGGNLDAHYDVLANLLRDDAKKKPAQWSVRIDDLSASGSGYGNAPGIGRFATSRETRAATPNLLNLALNADVSLPYDADGFAWENRARLTYAALSVYAVPNAPPAVQEQLDDIVLSTEVRVGPYSPAEYLPLFPFARLAFDTEHTALVVRAPPDPTVPTTLAHQLLLQESVGVALRPQGSWLKDARVGFLVQEDASEVSVGVPLDQALHYDAGFVGGLSLAFPFGAAVLTSETEARYLFPDPDDRFEDLGLRIRSNERLKVPVTEDLAVFLFVDFFALTSKSFDAASGSMIVGAGLTFARVFPL